MKTKENREILKEPSTVYGGRYSYADYLTWQLDEMVEIIKGKLFKMAAAPSRIHQKVVGKLYYHFTASWKGNHARFISLHLMCAFRIQPPTTRIFIPSFNRISA